MSDMVVRVSANLEEFKAKMALMDSQIDTTAASLKRMGTAFDPAKTISDANAAVIKITELGGASKLTDAAQAKLNRTLEEAIQAYQRLGREAPDTMIAMRDATAKAAVPVDTFNTNLRGSYETLQRWAGYAGIGIGIEKVFEFGKQVFDTAGNIGDLSTKLGTSAEFVQRMQHVAQQSGTTIETFGTAIAKMNATLSAGETGTIDALKRAGLEFETIRAMRPEEAFYTIAEAIQRVEDPMLRAELAVKLFGKSGQDLLPAIADGIREVGAAAAVMSDQTVASLKQAQDNWTAFGNSIVVSTGEKLGWIIEKMRLVGLGLDAMSGDMSGVQAESKRWQASIDAAAASVDQHSKSLIAGLPPIKSAAEAEREFAAANGESEQAIRKNVAAFDAHVSAVRQLVEQWTGGRLAERVRQYADALEQAGGATKLTAYETAGLVRELGNFLTQGAQLSPALLDLYRGQQNFTAEIDGSTSALLRVINSTGNYRDSLLKLPPALKSVEQSADESLGAVGQKADETAQKLAAMVSNFPKAGDPVGALGRTDELMSDPAYLARQGQLAAASSLGLGFQNTSYWKWLSGARADGGPVSGGSAYLVGERGPEVFVPQASGTILPNGGSMGGVHLTVNITQPLGTAQAISAAVSSAVMQTLRGQGMRFGASL